MLDHLPILLLFTAFHPLWWLLIVATSAIIIYDLDEDRGFFATATVIAAFLAFACFSDVHVFRWIADNPLKLLSYVGLYFAGGALWSLVKWYLFVSNRREQYEDEKIRWLKDKNVFGSEIPDGLKEDWKNHLLSDYSTWSENTGEFVDVPDDETQVDLKFRTYRKAIRRLKLIPIAWENKSRIITWMSYWPWSLLWAITNDFVRKVFKRIQRMLADLMDYVAKLVFKGTEKDFTTGG